MNGRLSAILMPELHTQPGRRRDVLNGRLVDSMIVLFALAYGVMVPIGDAMSPEAVLPWQADVAVGVLCCLALFTRRHQPVILAAVLIPLTIVSVMASGAAAIALFTVAIRRRAGVAALFFLAYVATGPLYHLAHGAPAFPFWMDLAARVLLGAAALGWGMFVRAHRALSRSLRNEAARLESEKELRAEQARLAERSRIAREMHDVLAHRLSLVSLHAGALSVRPDASPEEVAAAADTIRAGAREALQELRSVIGLLRSDDVTKPDPPQPGLEDMRELIDGARASGMEIAFANAVVLTQQPSALLGRTAYRLVQEGLTNARKHAPGGRVDVRIAGLPGNHLEVYVANALMSNRHDEELEHQEDEGFPGAGMGLVGVTERVSLAGGHVEYGPDEDQFRLKAWLPWTS